MENFFELGRYDNIYKNSKIEYKYYNTKESSKCVIDDESTFNKNNMKNAKKILEDPNGLDTLMKKFKNAFKDIDSNCKNRNKTMRPK